jgi:hypothetical protein
LIISCIFDHAALPFDDAAESIVMHASVALQALAYYIARCEQLRSITTVPLGQRRLLIVVSTATWKK